MLRESYVAVQSCRNFFIPAKLAPFDDRPGARFSKVPIINGPGKLLPFTLKIEVFKSFVSNVITDYQLMKQNGVVC